MTEGDTWQVTAVLPDETGDEEFSYSWGLLQEFNHPEIIVFGLPGRAAYSVIAAVVAGLEEGARFEVPQKYDGVLAKFPIAIQPVHEANHLFLADAMSNCRRTSTRLRVVQLLWPDRSGIFPFETGCDPKVVALQPSLRLPR